MSLVRHELSETISAAAAERLRMVYEFLGQRPAVVPPSTLEQWDRQNETSSQVLGQFNAMSLAELDVSLREESLGNVSVLRIIPHKRVRQGVVLLYVHGGGYTYFSAKVTSTLPALVALRSCCEVISIDYTVAPRGNWRSATGEVESVYRALLAQGYASYNIGIFGDSAGGGLAAGSIFRFRDNELPLPAALALMSPWSDISNVGDTFRTLADADPTLTAPTLAASAQAYAPDPADHRHPYVSPVYGDYSQSYPPTLIQGGTREIFVSHCVRHYQAIASGGEAYLDLYEGMPHVFQSLVPFAPEGTTAINRAADFLVKNLGG
jgi:monoterpene epsilon-lactone hydrolase